jgi:Domain of unknown function (DUF6438)
MRGTRQTLNSQIFGEVVSLAPVRILGFSAALFLAAAGARAESPITKIVLERTACFGTCPVYTLTVLSSGEVEFAGEDHVKVKGTQTGHISAGDFARLVKKIDAIDFFNLRNRYDGRNPDGSGTTVTDLPTKRISVTRGGEAKTVEDYFRAPPGLSELETLIDELAKSSKWIRG